ncbi:MAG: tetratricopeptide repeat protein [Bacteroidales bacterium]|nr:tetratricopeptide repeat protein [Bacteroidales bacterium]
MKKQIVFIVITILSISNVFSQSSYEKQEMFLDANSWFSYEDYKEALPIFLRLEKVDTANYNLMYKIAYCYLHIQGQKSKAISYFEKATQNITTNYKKNTYSEKQAPREALFYLGNAYLVNNRINDAVDAYTRFEKLVSKSKRFIQKGAYDTAYLSHQLKVCKNAIAFQHKPINFIAQNLGNKLNSRFNEFNAVVSGDGKSMAFTSSLQFYDAIFYSKKVNGKWSSPINIMGQLKLDDKCSTTGMSYDGTELYIYNDDNFDGNIYVSKLKNNIWGKAVKLGDNINTKYWEAHASVSPDNKTLFFVSNRKNGIGDLDIYMSKRTSDTTWGKPQNLGSTINTKWNENTPFLSSNGRILFFSSEGHTSMGGYDIFYSVLNKDGSWSKPVNVGYPVNTTDDDIFLVPYKNDGFIYCSRFLKRGFGQQDIYKYHLFNIPRHSSLKVEGVLTMDNKSNRNKESFIINIINKSTLDTIITLNPDKDKVKYQTVAPSGENHLIYESHITKDNKQYYISSKYDIKEVFKSETEQTDKLARIQKPSIVLSEDQKIINTNKDDVNIKLILENGDKLIVYTYHKSKLRDTENFIPTKDFSYDYKALKGKNRIIFVLVDSNNHRRVKEVLVNYSPKDSIAELDIKDKQIATNADGEKITIIKLKAEKESTLTVETIIDGEMINTEEFEIKRKNFSYKYTLNKNAKLRFKLIDKYNNEKIKLVIISYYPISENITNILSEVKAIEREKILSILSSREMQKAESLSKFIDTLYEKALQEKTQNKQLQALIIALALNIDSNTENFIVDLLKISDGDLKLVLEQISKHKVNYKTNIDVINQLILQKSKYNYSNKDIVLLLENYLRKSDISIQKAINLIKQILQIDIAEIIEKINSINANINNIDDLMKAIKNSEIYSRSELQLINSLLQAKLIVSDTSLRSSNDQIVIETKQQSETESKFKLFYILIGFILAFGLILLLNRRKRQ